MSFQSAKHAYGSSNREAKGFVFLILLLLTPFLIQYSYRALFYQPREIYLTGIEYLTDSCETKTTFTSNPYTSYRKQNFVYNDKSITEKSPVVKVIDINSADTSLFKSLPGIGSVYAARIVKYRKLLGGFVSINQIKEVYGIKIETFEQIQSLITIQNKQIKKIPADSLWDKPFSFYHPYLSKELKYKIQSETKISQYSTIKLKEIIEHDSEKLLQYIF